MLIVFPCVMVVVPILRQPKGADSPRFPPRKAFQCFAVEPSVKAKLVLLDMTRWRQRLRG